MKRQLEYSHIAKNKLLDIRVDLSKKYGDDFSKKTISKILKSLRQLEEHSHKGIRISEMYEVDSDYYYVFLNHNYFIYRIEEDKVIIVQIFHEKQDFIYKLFGISGRTQESIDFWGQ